jgi:hypothetical protein
LNTPINSDLNGNGSLNGTNDFQLYNAYVTAAVNSTGQLTDDAIIGHYIIDNLRTPYAKLVDLDVSAQAHSTIYGMKFGINWNNSFPTNNEDIAFYGNWTRSVIAQNIWQRFKCNNTKLGDSVLGAQSTSVITGIKWYNLKNSAVLTQLRDAANGGNLAVRLTLNYYSTGGGNVTLGYVLGVIGVPSLSDTLNVPGERVMYSTSEIPADLSMTLDATDRCFPQKNFSRYSPWMFTVPFEVAENEVRMDLSNSLPMNRNSLQNIGTLQLGLRKPSCILLLGDESGIPYFSDNDFPITSGIYTIKIPSSQMDDVSGSSLVIAQVVNNADNTEICGESTFSMRSSHSVIVLLEESEYYIRPKGYYVGRMDSQEAPTFDQSLFVTRYGSPATNMGVSVSLLYSPVPRLGVVAAQPLMRTNSTGHAHFQFSLQENIPQKRFVNKTKCFLFPFECGTDVHLPIDGQVYEFSYCLSTDDQSCAKIRYGITIAIHAYSDVFYSNTPTWVTDVSPILTQYANLAPIMKAILDMSNYTDVTKPQNINLLNFTLRLDFDDPSFMPTTRNLSPVKRDMILQWLEFPIYNSSNSAGEPETPLCVPPPMRLEAAIPPAYFTPPRCASTGLSFDERPQDEYFENILIPFPDTLDSITRERPLFDVTATNSLQCTRENVMKQLQTAIQLEWGIIPVYLTSLYSIVDGCNTEIYSLIRSVIIQEMLHMTLAANMLIAMNGSPLIDDASVTLKYPARLPGKVLPRLVVNLERFSPRHAFRVFMAIEVPEETSVSAIPTSIASNYTIGSFYGEIETCIQNLSTSELFSSATLPRQVKWPWKPSPEVGRVFPITDSSSAIAAIRAIVAQGEGADPLTPDQLQAGNRSTLAHYFKFEETVCQRQLEKLNDTTYGYTGPVIPFQQDGVWPMRLNPTTSTIRSGTSCYTESRAFHTTYRKLLQKLQDVFNGSPDEIFVAVQLMESLQVHAKKLMWTKFDADTTCGPVWEYDWPLPEPSISDLTLIVDSKSACSTNRVSTAFLPLFLIFWCYSTWNLLTAFI